MATIAPTTADRLGRTAAETGMSEVQLRAVMVALGCSATAAVSTRTETERRRRLLWIAEGRGDNDAEI